MESTVPPQYIIEIKFFGETLLFKFQKVSQPLSGLKGCSHNQNRWHLIALTLAYKSHLSVKFRRFYPWSKLAISLTRLQKWKFT